MRSAILKSAAAILASSTLTACLCPSDNYLDLAQLEDVVDNGADSLCLDADIENPKSKSENLEYVCRIECPEPSENSAENLLLIKRDSTYGVSYALEWDCRKRAQRWSAMQMYHGNSARNVRRSGDDAWHEDEDIPVKFRTTYADHYQNGYDRGHIIASADRLGSKAVNRETFVYSNVHPQLSELNSGIWMEMEDKLRSWNVDEFRDTLYVAKGGTIDGDSQILGITDKGLIVPKYFFMAVLCLKDGRYKAMAFWIEHKRRYTQAEHRLGSHAISVEDLERLTGINFFYNLEPGAQQEAESVLRLEDWGLQ